MVCSDDRNLDLITELVLGVISLMVMVMDDGNGNC
jgi:hypothetical protein